MNVCESWRKKIHNFHINENNDVHLSSASTVNGVNIFIWLHFYNKLICVRVFCRFIRRPKPISDNICVGASTSNTFSWMSQQYAVWVQQWKDNVKISIFILTLYASFHIWCTMSWRMGKIFTPHQYNFQPEEADRLGTSSVPCRAFTIISNHLQLKLQYGVNYNLVCKYIKKELPIRTA